jgi:hypothetical protein
MIFQMSNSSIVYETMHIDEIFSINTNNLINNKYNQSDKFNNLYNA